MSDILTTKIVLEVERSQLDSALRQFDKIARIKTLKVDVQVGSLNQLEKVERLYRQLGDISIGFNSQGIAAAQRIIQGMIKDTQELKQGLAGIALGEAARNQAQALRRELRDIRSDIKQAEKDLQDAQTLAGNISTLQNPSARTVHRGQEAQRIADETQQVIAALEERRRRVAEVYNRTQGIVLDPAGAVARNIQEEAQTKTAQYQAEIAFARQTQRQQALYAPTRGRSSSQLETDLAGLREERAALFERQRLARSDQNAEAQLAAEAALVRNRTQQRAVREAIPTFSAGRLTDSDTLTQLGFAAAFGGIPSIIGAAIGGSTRLRGAGALLGSTLTQAAVGGLVEKPFEFAKQNYEQFKDAGLAFQRSILGISAIEQANNEVVNRSGTALPIDQQLAFQQNFARNIQLGARRQLLPLGIAGQTESTFVQGVTSALAQRGFQASPEQIAQISKLLGGAVVSQRPSLLDNTQQLLKDLQDVLGGGPNATRTVLSQLVRPAAGGLKNATSTEDIVSALRPLEAFAQAATQLQNPIVSLNKFTGALDNLRTSAGTKVLDALAPAFDKLAASLSDEKVIHGIEGIGSALGNVAATFIDLQAASIKVVSPLGEFVGFLSQLGPALQLATTGLVGFEAVATLSGKEGPLVAGIGGAGAAATGFFAGGLPGVFRRTRAAFSQQAVGPLNPNTGLGFRTGGVVPGASALGGGLSDLTLLLLSGQAGAATGDFLGTGLRNFLADNFDFYGGKREGESSEDVAYRKRLESLTGAKQQGLPGALFQNTLNQLGLKEDYDKFLSSPRQDPQFRLEQLRSRLTDQNKLTTPEGRIQALFTQQEIGSETGLLARQLGIIASAGGTGGAATIARTGAERPQLEAVLQQRRIELAKAQEQLGLARIPDGERRVDLQNRVGAAYTELQEAKAKFKEFGDNKGFNINESREDREDRRFAAQGSVADARVKLAKAIEEATKEQSGETERSKEASGRVVDAQLHLVEAIKALSENTKQTIAGNAEFFGLKKATFDNRSALGRQLQADTDVEQARAARATLFKDLPGATGKQKEEIENAIKAETVKQFQAADIGLKAQADQITEPLGGVDQFPFAGQKIALNLRSQRNQKYLSDVQDSRAKLEQRLQNEPGAIDKDQITAEINNLRREESAILVEGNKIKRDTINEAQAEREANIQLRNATEALTDATRNENRERPLLIDGITEAREALSDFRDDLEVRQGGSLGQIVSLVKQLQKTTGSDAIPFGVPAEANDILSGGLLGKNSQEKFLRAQLNQKIREFDRLPESEERQENRLIANEDRAKEALEKLPRGRRNAQENLDAVTIRFNQLFNPMVDFRKAVEAATAALHGLTGGTNVSASHGAAVAGLPAPVSINVPPAGVSGAGSKTAGSKSVDYRKIVGGKGGGPAEAEAFNRLFPGIYLQLQSKHPEVFPDSSAGQSISSSFFSTNVPTKLPAKGIGPRGGLAPIDIKSILAGSKSKTELPDKTDLSKIPTAESDFAGFAGSTDYYGRPKRTENTGLLQRAVPLVIAPDKIDKAIESQKSRYIDAIARGASDPSAINDFFPDSNAKSKSPAEKLMSGEKDRPQLPSEKPKTTGSADPVLPTGNATLDDLKPLIANSVIDDSKLLAKPKEKKTVDFSDLSLQSGGADPQEAVKNLQAALTQELQAIAQILTDMQQSAPTADSLTTAITTGATQALNGAFS